MSDQPTEFGPDWVEWFNGGPAMGEVTPPTEVDFAHALAQDSMTRSYTLENRILKIEAQLKRLVELVDEAVVMLAQRVEALEETDGR